MKRTKKIKPILSTIIMNLFIFLIFILCLEIGLRIFGYEHSQGRALFDLKDSKENIHKDTILCIGDSFTYGGNVKPNEIYPYYLWNILSKEKYNVRIVNRGFCERNSSQTLRELKNNIQKYKPKVVILLGGTSEKYNLIGNNINDVKYYDYPKEEYDNQALGNVKKGELYCKDIVSLTSKSTSFLRDIFLSLRVYKMVKAIVLDIEGRKVFFNLKRYKLDNLSCSRLGKEAFLSKIDELLEYYYYNRDYDKIFDIVFAAKEQSPADTGDKNAMDYYFLLFWAYQFQDRYDAHDVFVRLDKILTAKPSYKSDDLFMRYYRMFKDKQKFDKYIYERFKYNLREMIRLCQNNGIQIVFQNFPCYYTILNKCLEDVARQYRVPLVDNYSIFSELIKRDDARKYLVDDGHCTPLGYKIIAENVYSVLEKDKLLNAQVK
jgi:lysophospholipase L1-like esterase